MMQKTYVGAKIHGICVTQKSIHYHGSVAIDETLMEKAGMEEFEQVHVVNMNNGQRWVTYAIKAPKGVFSLNGGGARCGEIGDECVIMTYVCAEEFSPAKVVHVDANNEVKNTLTYTRNLYK